jgi:hypothetical protein
MRVGSPCECCPILKQVGMYLCIWTKHDGVRYHENALRGPPDTAADLGTLGTLAHANSAALRRDAAQIFRAGRKKANATR